MVKHTLAAVALAALAFGAAVPARADVTPYNYQITEPYGNLTSGRTFLPSTEDQRPKAGIQMTADGKAREAFAVTGFGGSFFENDLTRYGAGVAYANSTDVRHPWEVSFSFARNEIFGFHFDSHALQAKYQVFGGGKRSVPAVSIFGGVDPRSNGAGTRWAGGVAIDQAITKRLYISGQVNWAQYQPEGVTPGLDVIQTGVGASYQIGRHLSLSGDYMFENGLDEDRWSAALNYAPSRNLIVKAGGGKHESYFGSLTWKTDWNRK